MRSTRPHQEAIATATSVLELLIARRRVRQHRGDRTSDWPVQLDALVSLIASEQTLEFTLPAFPCKSPNPNKVAGSLPDEGERLALRSLNDLCEQITHVYPLGRT